MPFHQSPDGTRIHYRLAGPGKRGLVFIPGWCGNTTHWEPQARAFTRTHRVLRVDRRGDGRSEAPPGGYHPRDQADEIAGLIEALGMRDLVAIGHAGGTPATLQLATRHPQLITANVVIDWGPDRRPASERRAGVGQLPAEDEGYEQDLAARYEGFFGQYADRDKVKAWAAMAARTPRHVAMANRIGSSQISHTALMRRVRQPTLWINSTPRNMSFLRELLPHAEQAWVIGSGHFPQLEAPEQVNVLLRNFLERLERGQVTARN
jgi:pimeloyl-ACP methyl ester carboxylesterase